MFAKPSDDWSANRRAAALDQIVETAWDLAREHGLAGLSLRDLARRLGMAPTSLYSYVDSKHGLYDAMFAQGYRALLALGSPLGGDDVRTVLRTIARFYVQFSIDDPVRFQLLSQRTIPHFEPSPQAYALAQEAYEVMHEPLRAVVDVTQEDLDLLTAVVCGLISQQIAHDPGGTRWVRLVDDAVELIVPPLRNERPIRPHRGQPNKEEGEVMTVATATLHLALTVRDLDASVEWYGRVFGIHYQMDAPHPGGFAQLLSDDAWQLVIVLHRHDANGGEPFCESRTGLDHAGFKVPKRDDLVAWQSHLETHGVARAEAADRPLTQSPIADEPYGSVLVFRDPDNIQLESSLRRPPLRDRSSAMRISHPAPDVVALNDVAPIPGLGFLPVNA